MKKKFKHGLIIGKFFPPHSGHVLLIQYAAQECEQLTVGIFDNARREKILPLSIRKKAFEEKFKNVSNIRFVKAEDNVPIDYADSDIWARHIQIFKKSVDDDLKSKRSSLQQIPIDAVFTCDSYGPELARRFDCVHIPSERTFSATQFRENPIEHWFQILPTARAHLSKRFVIVGAESTGKTTLAQNISNFFQQKSQSLTKTQWVPEFGREYAAQKYASLVLEAQKKNVNTPRIEDIDWKSSDFLSIFNKQNEMENSAAHVSGPLLICDTDSFATNIWHERYMKSQSLEIEPLLTQLPSRTLYLLSDHNEVPFHQDGTRDGEHIRGWMTDRFEQELIRRNLPFIKLTGSYESRLQQAIQEIEQRLTWKWE